MREFHVSMRDLCIRYKGTLSGRNGRFISPIASLHESPRAATWRLDNTRESSVSPSWVNITPSRASCVYTFRDQSIYIHTYKHQFPMILVSRYTKNILNIYIDISRKISHDPFANNFYIRYRTRNFLNTTGSYIAIVHQSSQILWFSSYLSNETSYPKADDLIWMLYYRTKMEPCSRNICQGVVLGTWWVGSVLKNVMIGAEYLVEWF